MVANKKQQQFLSQVQTYNNRFNAIKLGKNTEGLVLNFWDPDEIRNAEAVKADWGIQEQLIPFYGDWHDVICLDRGNGEIIYLDDSRKCIYRWDSIDSFCAALTNVDETSSDTSGIIESHLDF